MSIQIQALFEAYNQLGQFIQTQQQWEDNFTPLQVMFEEKKQKPDANIMIYGVYNAGKSTVINALVGDDVAATGDVPLTSVVSEYQCGHFSIWDTPGIDAPKEHEQVTQEQLLKADAIVFVVNPVGVVEEEKTLSVLMDLFAQGKKVFLVFNDKHGLTEEDFVFLKDQTRQQLQHLARQQGLDDVLKDIPILKLNAKYALEAKQARDENFLEYSGYVEFEQALHAFISSITPEETYGRLKNALLMFIQTILTDLNNSSPSEAVKQYDHLMYLASGEKIATRKKMFETIDRYHGELHQQVKSWLNQDSMVDDLQSLLNQWIETKSQSLEMALKTCLEQTQHQVSMGIDQLEAALPRMKRAAVCAEGLDIEANAIEENSSSNDSFKIDSLQLDMAKEIIKNNVTPETVRATLELVKTYLPTLMKGVGAKTMDKWAGMIAGKAVPVLGVAISVGMGLYDAFREDDETKSLREQQEQMRLARERRQQQIEEIAVQVSYQVKTGFESAMNDVMDQFFNALLAQLKQIKAEFSEQDQKNSNLITELLQIKRQTIQA